MLFTERFKLLKLLSNRFSVTIFLILIQLVWLALVFLRLVGYSEIITTALKVLSILMTLHVISHAEVPAYRMGWVLLIMTLPLFGGLLYLLLGERRPARRLRLRLEKSMEKHGEIVHQDPEVAEALKEAFPRTAGLSAYIANFGRYPAWQNTQVKYHTLGEDQFEDMLAVLKQAERFIFLEYFVIEEGYMWDSILEILTQKVEQGVDVRVIYDDMACQPRLPSAYSKRLAKLGIKCLAFNPFIPVVSLVMNNRDHRKMMIIDGHTAFTGGINLADEYINHIVRFGHWKDTGVMLQGEAVWNFTVMFLEVWNAFFFDDEDYSAFCPKPTTAEGFSGDGFVQPFCDSPLDDETVSVNVYLDILAQAKDYVYILTPYLAISDELQIALCAAAKRGVDVRMVLPGTPDKKIAYRLSRSYYLPLMNAGVRIYEYTPGFMHAKSYVCDDTLAVVGTINMDYRSLYLHFECGVLMVGNSAIKDLKNDALQLFRISHEVTPAERRRGLLRSVTGGLIDAVLRVFAPLF